jgi:DNA-binding transcriptional LysR family regulator
MAAMSFERLRVFHLVAVRGTIAAAAREAGYTPSAVSQQLSALERDLGAALLERSNRGVTLTPAGARLRDRAATILDLVEAAAAEAAQGDPAAEPVALRIGAFPTAVTSIIVPAMAGLAGAVDLTIVDLEPEQALDELVARRLDAAVIDAYDDQPEPGRPGLRVAALLTDRLLVATSGGRAVEDASDLAGLPWVLAGPQSRLGRSATAALRSLGVVAPSVFAESDDHALTFAILGAVEAATVLPELALQRAPAPIATVTGIDLRCERRILLVTRAVRHPQPAIAALEAGLAAAAMRAA